MEDYLIGIGKHIKKIRKEKKKTIKNIASRANVSNGLISRIENGRTIPSLPVLFNIISALEVNLPDFFNDLSTNVKGNFIISRANEQTFIEREDDSKGFSYHYIFKNRLSSIGFEAVILEVSPNSLRKKLGTDAFEFKHVLSGECYYIIGEEEVLLKEGDSIFFDGRIPHVPENRSNSNCKMLVLYFF